jgi:hypothetical protein
VTRFTVRSTAPTVVAYFRGRTKKVGPLFCPCLSYWPCDRRGKKADKVWRYHDADGRLLGLVARWDLLPDGTERKRKRILPFAWCRDALGREEWRSKTFSRATAALWPHSLPRGLSGAAVMPVMSKHGAPQATASRRPLRRIMMLCSVLMSLRKFPVRKRVRRPKQRVLSGKACRHSSMAASSTAPAGK